MNAAAIDAEIRTHENRVVELKANLHDLDAQRADVARELEDEERTIAVLAAVADAAAEKQPEPAPSRRRAGEG